MARKQLHDFNLRAQPGTELVWTFDTTWGAEHFEAGSVVPDHIACKVHKMKDQFHRKRVQLWRTDGEVVSPADAGDEESSDEVGDEESSDNESDGESDEVVDSSTDGEDGTGEDEDVGDDGDDEDPPRPQPYKHGPGWWRIEGVDGAFRSADEAQAAWDLKDALGG